MKLKLLCVFTVALLTLTEWPSLSKGAPAHQCTVKPGMCPYRKWGLGKCMDYCIKDSDCLSKKKCCPHGCGQKCIIPYTGAPVKPGRCPIPKGTPVCAEYCDHDCECPGEQKCCRTTCGHACSELYY